MNYKIILTGGGTAGHVTPNLALISNLKEKNWIIEYIGSANGVEAELLKKIDIPYHTVFSGKLRRYFSFQNFMDPFKILCAIFQSFFIIRKSKPNIIFSKGGFVSFPVVVGAWLNRIPVIVHESDLTPGLANRLSFPFASKICITFDAARKYIKRHQKVVLTGTPIRKELFEGNKDCAKEMCGFVTDKPCILIIGGSLGAGSINLNIRQGLEKLLERFQVIHICGRGKLEQKLNHIPGYCQFEYVSEGLEHLYALASIVVSRSGANSLYEILALKKPHVLIPLSKKMSRGDQVQNAQYFENLGISRVLNDDTFDTAQLIQAIIDVFDRREDIVNRITQLNIELGNDEFIGLFENQIS